MIFKEHFKRVRKHSGMTQKAVAERLNISPQSISKWESGESLPTIEHLPKLAEIFDCSVSVFFSEYELELYEKLAIIDDSEIVELLLAECREGEASEVCGDELDFPIESLFLPALKEYLSAEDKVSAARLQKRLGIGYALASNILTALNNLGIVSKTDEGYVIKKDRVDLLDPYI